MANNKCFHKTTCTSNTKNFVNIKTECVKNKSFIVAVDSFYLNIFYKCVGRVNSQVLSAVSTRTQHYITQVIT